MYLCLSGAVDTDELANHPPSTFSPTAFYAAFPGCAQAQPPIAAHQANQAAANRRLPAAQSMPESHPTTSHLHVCT